MQCCQGWVGVPMLSPAMLRILRWLDDHPSALETAWDVPRSLSLEGIAEGIGVVRSALFQPMSTMEEQGLIRTRQAHVIGGGRRKRKVVHITEVGRNNLHSSIDDLPEPRSRTSSKLKGQLPDLTHLHGRISELQLIEGALERNVPIHLRGMPGIGKSTLARCALQHLVEKDIEVHWVQLDAYCDVQEAMNRMEVDAPHILDVEGYATYLEQRKVLLVFDDIHSISQRHQSSFSSLFRALEGHKIPFMLIGRDRDAFSIDGVEIDLGPLDPSDAIQLLDPELGDERTSIVEALGGHPLAILLYDASTPLPEAHLDVRAYVEQVVLGEASTEVHDAMSLFLVLPFPVPAERMPDPNHVPLLDEHTLLRWGAQNSTMEMQHLIRNVCKSSLDDSELDSLHLASIEHWMNGDDALASLLELHHRIQRGESEISNHLSARANELMSVYSGAFATLLDEALVNNPEELDLIELAAQHALNRAEVEIAKEYIHNFDDEQLVNIRLQIAQFEGKKGAIKEIESLLETTQDGDQKLRMQLSVLSRCIDDLTPLTGVEEYDRIDHLINKIELPENENDRQIILTTIVIMRHALAIEREDFSAANFLLEQLKGIASTSDPLLQYLTTKTELKSVHTQPTKVAIAMKNAELTASQLQQPLYKASLLLVLCEQLIETQLPRAKTIHAQIDIQSIEAIEVPSARRVVAKWWEVKSRFDDHERILALKEAILRYRSVGCPNRARMLSKRLHNV